MKCLVFIDHDIMCRHFLLNHALEPLAKALDVRLVFPEGGKRMKLDPATLQLDAPFDTLPIDARRQQYWHWLLFADQLALRPGRQEAAVRRMRRRAVGWKAATLLTIAGLPGVELLFKRLMARRLAARPNVALDALLDRERPDVVFHPTVLDGVFVNDLVAACRARRIPLIFAINSWDNPSTKRATVGVPDWLLVWGPQTNRHARRFMHLDPARVVSFGAAQFDAFAAEPRVTRDDFAAENDVDPMTKIVLFAGSNSFTDEVATLTALDEAIADGRLPRTSIVYRPHPWGLGGRGGDRIAKAAWTHVKVHKPMRAYVTAIAEGAAGMTLPDYRDTHDLLSSVDAVVSPLSTILVEAMLHGKPVAVFTPQGEAGSELLTNTMLPMLHFEEFLAVKEVARASTQTDLLAVLQHLLNPLTAPSPQQMQTSGTEFVTPFDRPWRERIVDFIKAAAESAPKVPA